VGEHGILNEIGAERRPARARRRQLEADGRADVSRAKSLDWSQWCVGRALYFSGRRSNRWRTGSKTSRS